MKRIGIDIGSTTIKCVVINEAGEICFSSYERHKSRIAAMTGLLLRRVIERFGEEKMLVAFSGSAGMGMANDLSLPFVQEVYATRLAVKEKMPEVNTVIELGGEDAKILFLTDTLEVRMNGTCAGGTGAFIDQMAELMNVRADQMETMAQKSTKQYTIASRCGVFAKSDIQPLLNQGALKEDVAASIFYAVVNQTIAGLAQGREISGNVLYLGGPLTFFPYLRYAFDTTLHITGTCPDNSLYFVAMGAALTPTAEAFDLNTLAQKAEDYVSSVSYQQRQPLFENDEQLQAFRRRHAEDTVQILDEPAGTMFLGIDAGSTTVKAVLCDEQGNLFAPMYRPNNGNPVPIVREYLQQIYQKWPRIRIASSAVTGYGEAIVKSAFGVDMGLVETVAHYTAASHFCKDVDFILDIGGQDIKCFKIRNGAIDSIFLNEACSSGCGSFLQTFAGVLGFTPEEFASLALKADAPVDLGSRCTVFMNSSVKQAQKDGASIENIAAGLAVSVVKNALYKVIRCINPQNLGKHIVVQGGTFLNDAVLRAFEQETGRECLRPSVAGLMGAYGAALYAQKHGAEASTLITEEALQSFTHTVKAINCNGCSNHCPLTINTFSGNKKYIAGNRCEKPLAVKQTGEKYDLFAYKLSLLEPYRQNTPDDGRPTVGIPMGLNMYDLLPFWHTLLTELGYRVIVSQNSTHETYVAGQHTIPSDTVCYPAKLLHGHIEELLKKTDTIFYPGMSYNVDEGLGKNHYNCPVVAYYPKVLEGNVAALKKIRFINGFIGLHDPKEFLKHFPVMMQDFGISVDKKKLRRAAEKAYGAYNAFRKATQDKADEFLRIAAEQHLPVIVLAGRPYHIDPEVNHGIDRLICDLGAIVLTEDSLAQKVKPFSTTVLNQWTYHSRLYAAAMYVASRKDISINLVQLVSFGCGVDAVTSDETRAILENSGKLYTQIKIDEITNLGAVTIRLRSLFAVTEDQK